MVVRVSCENESIFKSDNVIVDILASVLCLEINFKLVFLYSAYERYFSGQRWGQIQESWGSIWNRWQWRGSGGGHFPSGHESGQDCSNRETSRRRLSVCGAGWPGGGPEQDYLQRPCQTHPYQRCEFSWFSFFSTRQAEILVLLSSLFFTLNYPKVKILSNYYDQ